MFRRFDASLNFFFLHLFSASLCPGCLINDQCLSAQNTEFFVRGCLWRREARFFIFWSILFVISFECYFTAFDRLAELERAQLLVGTEGFFSDFGFLENF